MKRVFDIALSCLSLVLLAPLLPAIVLAIVVDSGWPVAFRQVRVGRGGRPFKLFKFRSMRSVPHAGRLITAAGDTRITRVGRFLRRSKLDELPQLINILRGDMSFVGPRPEVSPFVDLSSRAWRELLAVRPGLIDPASLAWTDEANLLASYSDPVTAYRQHVLPAKLAMSRAYLLQRTLRSDMQLIARTLVRFLKFKL